MSKSEITTIGEAYQKMCGEAISLFEKQQKRIAELEKQVQHLQKEDDVLEDTLSSLNFYQEQCKELKDERAELRDEVEQLRYKLKDEVAGWSPTSSPEPKMNN